jgi:DNA-binding IscR family transcriptional regulator
MPAEAAFLPARDPGRITAAEVIAAARGALAAPIDAAHLPLYREVRAAYERVEGQRTAAAGRITMADLAGRENAPPE